MTGLEVVAHLQERGFTLVADGDVLRCRPGSALTPEDLDTLRSMKADVLAALRAGPVPTAPPVTCFACRGTRFWRSLYNVFVCARCHPPADLSLVAAWIGEPEASGVPQHG